MDRSLRACGLVGALGGVQWRNEIAENLIFMCSNVAMYCAVVNMDCQNTCLGRLESPLVAREKHFVSGYEASEA